MLEAAEVARFRRAAGPSSATAAAEAVRRDFLLPLSAAAPSSLSSAVAEVAVVVVADAAGFVSSSASLRLRPRFPLPDVDFVLDGGALGADSVCTAAEEAPLDDGVAAALSCVLVCEVCEDAGLAGDAGAFAVDSPLTTDVAAAAIIAAAVAAVAEEATRGGNITRGMTRSRFLDRNNLVRWVLSGGLVGGSERNAIVPVLIVARRLGT